MASNFDEGKFSLVAQTNNGTRLDLEFCCDLFDGKDKRFINSHHRPVQTVFHQRHCWRRAREMPRRKRSNRFMPAPRRVRMDA
ncbi:MAG: hypothetical protein PHE27_07580, partial [Alphaproteobacteria bacterium]|nr:hypothetical protein [Alphaproteobacteria bacterium]